MGGYNAFSPYLFALLIHRVDRMSCRNVLKNILKNRGVNARVLYLAIYYQPDAEWGFVIYKASSITSVDQFDGKIVVMPATNALVATLLPRAEFVNLLMIDSWIRYGQSRDSISMPWWLRWMPVMAR